MLFVSRYLRVLLFGSFLSITILLFIVFKKVIFKDVFNFQTIIFALSIYATYIPFTMMSLENRIFRRFYIGLLFLVALYAELLLWFILFYGFQYFPASDYTLYFFIPLFIYAGLCILLIIFQFFKKT